MSAARALLDAARRQAALTAMAWVLPWWLALRLSATVPGPGWLLDLAALLALAITVARGIGARDARWLARRLDTTRPEFEDSAALLFGETPFEPLAALQRERLRLRIRGLRLRDLGLLPPWRALGLNLLAATLLALGLRFWPAPSSSPAPPAAPTHEATSPAASPPRLLGGLLTIEAPAYTGIESQEAALGDASAIEGSRLSWRLRVAGSPAAVALVFLDGEHLALAPVADDANCRGDCTALWQGEAIATRSTRYRVQLDAQPASSDAALRLEVRPDLPPRIEVAQPAQTLSLIEQAGGLRFEAQAFDDFGLGPAQLQITLAKGDGELVEVSERRIALRGEGDARQRRYAWRIDPATLGFGPGDDLILRLEVADNRQPDAQRARSPSYILRWPRAAASVGEGIEGVVQRTLPAYFRSQRQVIIDTEALIPERGALEAERFLARSDAIGVDQRLLRLRYGEFLGEEVEDANNALPEGHSWDDGHGHVRPEAFGDAEAVIKAYAHRHDHSEAATLFDPVTRERLRSALREMWQSELHLRQGDPELALPYQYRALDLIKQIQQASRIYLARAGLELPPIDFSRRGSGEVAGSVRAPRDPLLAREAADSPALALWTALDPAGADSAALAQALDGFEAWLAEHPSERRLDLQERVERLRLEPDCSACAAELRAALWTLLEPAPQGPHDRVRADALGRAWLDALPEAGE